MKGATEQGFNLILIVITFVVVLAIIFAVLSSGSASLKSFHDLGCNICNIFVGNFVSGLTYHILNPCTSSLNCCDPALAGFGGSGGFGSGGTACYGNLGTTTSTVRSTTTTTSIVW